MKRRPNPDEALIFDWTVREGSTARLFVASLITLGAFAALFVGFRIITPESRPVTTRPQQVLVLNPDVPAERALIHQAMDRSFALLPSDGVGATIPAAAQMPEYRPGIVSYEVKLRPAPAAVPADAGNSFLTLDLQLDAPVPPITPAPQVAAPPPRSVLRAVVEGAGAARLTSSNSLEGVSLADPSKPRFQVAIGPRGQVLMALPLFSSEDAAAMEQLRKAVIGLQFRPAQADVEWAQIGFRWEEARP